MSTITIQRAKEIHHAIELYGRQPLLEGGTIEPSEVHALAQAFIDLTMANALLEEANTHLDSELKRALEDQ